MKTIEIGEHSFIHVSWHYVSAWFWGLGFDFGWFPDISLIGLQLCLFEWAEDSEGGASGLTVLRFQVLFFLIAINVHWRSA